MSTLRDSAERTARFEAVGVIAKAIGSDGAMLLRDADTVSLDRMVGETVFLVPPPLRRRARTIKSIELAADGVRVSLAGIDSRGAAQGLVGLELVAAAEHLALSSVALGDDPEDELLGWRVIDRGTGFQGVVTEYFETRAHPIIQAEGESGTALIPLVDEFVLDIDSSDQVILVQLIEGMVEER